MRNYTLWGLLLCLASLAFGRPLLAAPTLTELRSCFATQDEAAFSTAHYRYTESGKRATQRMLVRFRQVESMLDELLLEADAPLWLKYVTLAESRLQPSVVSQAGAAGIWQIMPRTGRSLGLRIDRQVDERLDMVQSTRVAIAYLQKLHATFGDWMLALAAYNCGAGNVRKAQRRAGAYDYASIRNFLPPQTRRYLPRLFTIGAIATNPTAYDFAEPEVGPLRAVVLQESSSLQEVAQCLGIAERVLRQWNPSFRKGQLLVEGESLVLWVPRAELAAAPPRQQIWSLNNALHIPVPQLCLPFTVVGVAVV